MKKTQTVTLENIPLFSQLIARQLKGGEILALIGTLGSGKTTFTSALARELRIRKPVTSPTFTIMNMFPVRLNTGRRKEPGIFYHLDLYRTNSFREVEQLGITDFWGKKNTITLIEWADKIISRLPKKTKIIYFI